MGGIASLAGPYLAEAGFSGAWWRQVVETINGHLIRTFGLHFPGARTKRSLLTHLAAKLLAVNVGLWLNLLIFGRPPWAFATLFPC